MKRLFVFLMLLALLAMPAGAEGEFDYSLPTGYHIENVTEAGGDIICVGQRVGGIAVTGLPFVPREQDVIDYLVGTLPEGWEYEYMMGGTLGGVRPMTVDFIRVKPDTMEFHEYTHYFFFRGQELLDMWLDDWYVDGWEACRILQASGIDPQAECILPEQPQSMPELDLPEGFTLGTMEAGRREILRAGESVGCFARTNLPLEALHNAEELESEADYPAMAPGEYALLHYLAGEIPLEDGWEYIIMYWEDVPMVEVTFQITETATGRVSRCAHRFFSREGIVYDLCLDCAVLEETGLHLGDFD